MKAIKRLRKKTPKWSTALLGASLLACGPQGLPYEENVDWSAADFADPEVEGIPELAYLPLTAAKKNCTYDATAKKVTWPMEASEVVVFSIGAVDNALYGNSTRCDTTTTSGVPVTVNDFKQLVLDEDSSNTSGYTAILDFLNGTFGTNNGGNPGILLSGSAASNLTLKIRGTRNAENYALGQKAFALNGNRRADIKVATDIQTEDMDDLSEIVVSLIGGSDRFTGQGADDIGDAITVDNKLTVYGGSGSDFIDGTNGADKLYGGEDNDTLAGYTGADTLYGDEGNDVFKEIRYSTDDANGDPVYTENGNDKFFGGDGTDTVDYSTRDDEIIVNLAAGGKDGKSTVLTLTADTKLVKVKVAGNSNSEPVTIKVVTTDLADDESITLSGCATGDSTLDTLLNAAHTIDGNPTNGTITTDPIDNSHSGGVALAEGNYGCRAGSLTSMKSFTGFDFALSVASNVLTLITDSTTAALKVGEAFKLKNCTTAAANGRWFIVKTESSGVFTADFTHADVVDDVTCAIDSALGGTEEDHVNSGDGDGNGSGIEIVKGGTKADILIGTDAAESLYGNDGNDVLFGGKGDDSLFGEDDDDLLMSTDTSDDGADWLSGGTGTDTVDYAARISTAHVRITLDSQANDGLIDAADNTESKELDNIRSDVENIIGGAGNDTITGSSSNNEITGGAGADKLYGGGGDDTFIHGATGANGADEIYGGSGYDRIDYSAVTDTDGVLVYLNGQTKSGTDNDDTTTATLGAEGDILHELEDVVGSSGAPNIVFANGSDNVILGGSDNDKIYAMAGDDFVDTGTAGTEVVSCGGGQGDLRLGAQTPTYPGLMAGLLAYGSPTADVTVTGVGVSGTINTNLSIANGELDGKILCTAKGSNYDECENYMLITGSLANGNLTVNKVHANMTSASGTTPTIFYVLDPAASGVATGGSTTDVQDSSRSFIVDEFAGGTLVQLKSGEGKTVSTVTNSGDGNTATAIKSAVFSTGFLSGDDYAVFYTNGAAQDSVKNCEL